MSTVYVCPIKDIECGDNCERWCSQCPKWPVVTPQAESLTKREYFAGLALQGILSASHEDGFYSADGKPARTMAENYRYGAEIAVGYADALIAALNTEPQS